MTTLEFFIPSDRLDSRGRPAPLPGRNEMEKTSRSGAYAGGALKKRYTEYACLLARFAASRVGWIAPDHPVHISFVWHEVNHRRDQDNIKGFEKCVLDGLQMAGVIKKDSQRFIEGFTAHNLVIDPGKPGVWVIVHDRS